jgi:poly-beta-1,6-N-acetyl-D-glucosamine synthase
MSGLPPSYAVVTPARDEADNLRRLASSLALQSVLPTRWVIVDDGSTDETPQVIRELEKAHDWIRGMEGRPLPHIERGGPIVRAFQIGLGSLVGVDPDVVVKVDADVSFDNDYFERLLGEFSRDGRLGIASGAAWELQGGTWVRQHMTGDSVWGAARAYRRACLDAVLPLEERMGWDGIDAYKALLAGWSTRTIEDLPFRHHRLEGERDGARRRAWAAQGRASYFMGYRFPYLAARALHRSAEERAALAMVPAYLAAWARREPRCADEGVRALIRREQGLLSLPARIREARKRASGNGDVVAAAPRRAQ